MVQSTKGRLPPGASNEYQVHTTNTLKSKVHNNITSVHSLIGEQQLPQVEEMLISNSGVLPIMSLYRLPHGQYAYSGQVIKCLLMYDHCRFAKLAP